MVGVLVAAVCLLLLAACGDEGSGESPLTSYPEIEIGPADICNGEAGQGETCRHIFNADLAVGGGALSVGVEVRNPGERVLRVKNIAVEQLGDAFSIEFPDDWTPTVSAEGAYLVAPLGGEAEGAPDLLRFSVAWSGVDPAASGVLVIQSDASNKPSMRVGLALQQGMPRLQLSTDHVDFGVVPVGAMESKNVTLLNTGGTDVVVDRLLLMGSSAFTVTLHGAEFESEGGLANGITLDEPLVIKPQASTYLTARFDPEDGEPAQAELTLYSNDPEAIGGKKLAMLGNMSVPCIAVNPESVDFGGKLVGEISVVPVEIVSCGDLPLQVTDLDIVQPESHFGLDFTTLPRGPTEEAPLLVPTGGTVVVNVTYFSEQESPVGLDGFKIPDVGTLRIRNNSFNAVKEVTLRAVAGPSECPVAVIKVAEGDEVAPQTVIHLIGDESFAPVGTVSKWAWTVEQPVGSASVFVPSATFPNPTFEANVMGLYRFTLTVFDQAGTPSCYPAVAEVLVNCQNAIHVELLWHTPDDPDETDTGPEAGSDLDLHFVHPWAAGADIDGDGAPDGWFDMPFDTFWFNAHPNWGSFDPNGGDDPRLDRDDTDGAGPENLNLDSPEDLTYRIGVHYWNDHGYGAAYATVRVYVYGALVFEVNDVLLVDKDMWDVATIEWPEGKVQLVTGSGGYKITPNYETTLFPNP